MVAETVGTGDYRAVTLILQNVLQGMIKREREKWPPDSIGAYYQPMRPGNDKTSKSDDKAGS